MRASPRTIAVVTGTRGEFGLLRSVIRAMSDRPEISVEVVAGGEHDQMLAGTIPEVTREFEGAQFTEFEDVVRGIRELGVDPVGSIAVAPDIELDFGVRLGVEVVRNAVHLSELRPDVVVVLGDRIEAFAAASAAAVNGIRIAHMHGGDRAEGIADESLRHAISKLAHLHLPATETSANRLIAMGEEPSRIHVVGSPAIDDVAATPPLSDVEFTELGSPQIVCLLHPTGDDDAIEHERASRLLTICRNAGPTLALHPNHDPGRAAIVRAIDESRMPQRAHLPRHKFLGLLRRAKVLVGNSSAGLIEGAAVPIWCVNAGPRQGGRERAANVISVENWDYQTIEMAVVRALTEPIGNVNHPFGDGHTGTRVAELLAMLPMEMLSIRKRNTY